MTAVPTGPTLASLSRAELSARLARGLVFRTGQFTVRLQCAIGSVTEGLHRLYGAHPLLDDDAFVDFHLRMKRPATLRRWYRPKVDLLYDGQAIFKPLPLAQAFPLFEWGLNWCVANRAHTYLMIHAAVLERGGRAVILPAPPGSGKSTLCAALAHRGWRLLSDELTLIRLDDGHVVPVPRPISLKNASIGVMRAFLDQPVFSDEVADTAKGTIAHLLAPADAVARGAESARPAWVIFPKYRAGSPSLLEPMPKAQAHLELAQNAFNYSLLMEQGFDTLGLVIGMSGCYRYTYSVLDEAIAVFDGLAAQP